MGIGSPLGNLIKTYFKFGAITTIDINSQKVFEGVAFSWSRRFMISGGSDVDIVIDPTGITAGKKAVILPISLTGVLGGPVISDLYFGTISSDSDGVEWLGSNRDNSLSTPPDTKIRLSPTVSNVGTKTDYEFLVPSTSGPGRSSFGGQSKDDLIFLPRIDGKYMLRLNNTDSVQAMCVFAMTIFEAFES